MRKIKLLLTIPALTAPATIAFTGCSNGTSQHGIVIDESISEKFDSTIGKDEEGNVICNLQLKSESTVTSKISSIKVTLNGNDLVANEDYSVVIQSNTEGAATVTIFAKTIQNKQGKYVIVPVLAEKQFNGIVAELERKTYHQGDKVTKDNIIVYKSIEGTIGDIIGWDNDIKVYENDTLISNFKTDGFKLTTSDKRILKIVFNNFSTTIEINVSKKEYTITCSIDASECGTLSSNSFVAQDGDVWGPLSKPTFQPKQDVDAFALTWDWYDANDTLIPGTKVIDSAFAAKMKVDWASDTTSTASKTADTAYDKWGVSAYIPAENIEGSGETRVLIPKEYNTDALYTITINATGKNIRYFWLKNCDEHKVADLVYLYKRNVVSLKVGETAVTNFTINDYYRNGVKDGSYVELPNTVTSGTIEIQIRMLKDITLIPAFQDVLA